MTSGVVWVNGREGFMIRGADERQEGMMVPSVGGWQVNSINGSFRTYLGT